MPCYRWDGSKWVMTDRPLFRRWDGSKWVDTHPKYFNGKVWVDAEKEKVPVVLTLTANTASQLQAEVRILPLKSGLQYPSNPHTYYVKLYGMGSSTHYFPAPRVYTLNFSSDTLKSNIITLGTDYEYQTCDFWLETRDGIVTDKYSTSFGSIYPSMSPRIKRFFAFRSSEIGFG